MQNNLRNQTRIGYLTPSDHPVPAPEAGTTEDYHRQQYDLYKFKGVNCTDKQFGEWFTSIYSQYGSTMFEGEYLAAFITVPDRYVGVELTLNRSDYMFSVKNLELVQRVSTDQ